MTIGGSRLILPLVALEDYARNRMSFSLGKGRDKVQEQQKVDDLIRQSSSPRVPMEFHELTVVVTQYGLDDGDARLREVCLLLSREWSRYVCENPWAAVRQALPYNRFKLVDLSKASEEDATRLFNCSQDGKPLLTRLEAAAKAVLVCRAELGGSFQTALVRISGELGAIWTVWDDQSNHESARAMAYREGEAIKSFVSNASGIRENFSELQKDMCRLRRPASSEGVAGSGCKTSS